MESDVQLDPEQMLKDDMLAQKRWREHAEAAFEDLVMETFTQPITSEMRDMLLEVFITGASWGETR
jgi:hypothetical protein